MKKVIRALALTGPLLAAQYAVADITINDSRTFQTNVSTAFFLDDEAITESQLQAIGPGLVATVEVADDVSNDFTSGTALSVDLDNQIKGPVTAVEPLAVLGQTVVVTGDTVLADLPGGAVANLAVGDIVEVSGYAAADGSVRATRLEYKPTGTPVWKLSGGVTSVAAAGFNIGAQNVLFNGVAPRDCDAGLSVGTLVEVKATSAAGFSAGAALATVTDIECQQPGLNAPPGQTTPIPAEVEGLVTALNAVDDFVVGGQRVRTTATTVFRGGGPDDLVLGAKLEAEGVLDTVSGVLSAAKISFREVRVRIEAPAEAVTDDTVTLLGIVVQATAQTRDEDAILGASAVAGQQIEVRGFRDGQGQVFATRIRERGDADLNDVRLRGPVGAVAQQRLEILGVTIDTATSTLRGANGSPLTPEQFFAQVGVGSQVQIEDASYDSARNTISGGQIEIEELTTASSSGARRLAGGTARRGTAVGGIGIGTLTNVSGGGGLFADGFE